MPGRSPDQRSLLVQDTVSLIKSHKWWGFIRCFAQCLPSQHLCSFLEKPHQVIHAQFPKIETLCMYFCWNSQLFVSSLCYQMISVKELCWDIHSTQHQITLLASNHLSKFFATHIIHGTMSNVLPTLRFNLKYSKDRPSLCRWYVAKKLKICISQTW